MKKPLLVLASFLVAPIVFAGCGGDSTSSAVGGDDGGGADGTSPSDGATGDSGRLDGAPTPDGGAQDGSGSDGGQSDGGTSDGGTSDSASMDTGTTEGGRDGGTNPIQTVFVIMMENHVLSDVKGSASAPYFNGTLIVRGARLENYKTPPANHPSEPNYLWLESGSNLGITDDNPPATNHQSTPDHLVTQLKNANISWKAYAEQITAGTCPIVDSANALYSPKHTPMVFFDDVAGNPPSASNAYCIAHVRPFSELAADLTNNTVARYTFITPDLCNDSHGSGFGGTCANFGGPDLVRLGDDWLAAHVPAILASQAYLNNGALFIIWDEGSGLITGSDGPLPFVVLSPKAKVGYANTTTAYTHSSTLRTFETIFGVPFLRGAATATDLSDLFTSFP